MIRSLFLTFCLVTAPIATAAQTDLTLGTIDVDPSQDVEITADSLSVAQDTGAATFDGNVVIGQGDLRIAAGRVEVNYDRASGDIAQLIASNGVTFVTATDAAEAQNADYNLQSQTLILSGDVLLTQGPNAISAQRMVINLATGTARMEGRVRTILNAGGN